MRIEDDDDMNYYWGIGRTDPGLCNTISRQTDRLAAYK